MKHLGLWTRESYPRYIRVRYTKVRRDFRDGQGHREEVKRIPGPAQETRREHEPLVSSELPQDGNGVSQFVLYARCMNTVSNANGPHIDRPTLGGARLVTRVMIYRPI